MFKNNEQLTSRKKAYRVFWIIFIVLLAIYACYEVGHSLYLKKLCTEETVGIVADYSYNVSHKYRRSIRNNNRVTYTYTVNFEVNGNEYTVNTPYIRTKKEPGDLVPVWYDPDDPSTACCIEEPSLKGVYIIVLVVVVSLLSRRAIVSKKM